MLTAEPRAPEAHVDLEVFALTLWQPYAGAVAAGLKTLETRGWPLPKRLEGQLVAIHAAARAPVAVPGWDRRLWPAQALVRGAVVAVARAGRSRPAAEVVHACGLTELNLGDYGPGRYATPLLEVRELADPIPYRGLQRVWYPDAGTAAKLREAWHQGGAEHGQREPR